MSKPKVNSLWCMMLSTGVLCLTSHSLNKGKQVFRWCGKPPTEISYSLLKATNNYYWDTLSEISLILTGILFYINWGCWVINVVSYKEYERAGWDSDNSHTTDFEPQVNLWPGYSGILDYQGARLERCHCAEIRLHLTTRIQANKQSP